MTNHLRLSSLAVLFIAFALFAPPVVRAQLPPPATPGSHPSVTPPTKAPTKTLPATPLPNGSLKVPDASPADGPASTSTAPSGNAFSVGNGTMLSILIGVGVLILAGIGWFIVSRRTVSSQTETAEVVEGKEIP
jgi:hypothetical protein